jgi:hypothetical protein
MQALWFLWCNDVGSNAFYITLFASTWDCTACLTEMRYLICARRFEAADSANRVESELVAVRVEAGARHKLYMKAALSCESPQQLADQVNQRKKQK